mgnify:CR=1 FL=1
MTRQITTAGLIRKILPKIGTLILRNDSGSMELRGQDLKLKESAEWLTLYHASAPSSESRSHLHLRKKAFRYAHIVERDGGSPCIAFWPHKQDRTGDRPPLCVFFPSFYDWERNKAPIAKNRRYFRKWIERNGREFKLE